ncbi:TorF family putative porin [Sandaracinobacteroides hominis]|uniref:TorF family putative porin n=1 Tax=Sandaracinobacteroides hominis TaxID=2780086 RepID=UPI0018F5AE1A|nr:TorF family putative porin [Sandaracinobacteroides hominis]
MNSFFNIGGRGLFSGALLLSALAMPVAASAQDEEAKPISFTGSAAFVSDYRFRGVSYSDLDPAVQAGITLNTKPGFFVSMWGSSIADYAGSTTEIDIYGGWTGALAGITTTVGVYGYFYPGSSDTTVVELYASGSMPLGPVTATAGINWAPDQKNLSRSSRYFYGGLSAAIPSTPITLKGTLGNERGALVVDESGRSTSKWDWLIGADITFSPITVGIAYVGNDLSRSTIDHGEGDSFRANRLAKDGIVLSLTAAF